MYHKLADFDFKNKKTLVRVDFNVPTDDFGNITDPKRIEQAIPTIKYLLESNAKIILMTHFGRPDGKKNLKYSLKNVGAKLSELLKLPVETLDDCIGEKIKQKIDSLNSKEIVLLENLRFYLEEESNEVNFAKQLAEFGELYVNDAFGTCHRAHASVHAITKFLPACAGLLLEKEIEIIGNAINNPKKPFVVILGGAKVSDKIGVIKNLSDKADYILIGGAMANTFLKSLGHKMGKSKCEDAKLDLAKELYQASKEIKLDFACAGSQKKLVLPWDVVCAKDLNADSSLLKSAQKIFLLKNFTEEVPEEFMALDVGLDTIKMFEHILKDAKTIIWNGPLGFFEKEPFDFGTKQIAEFISNLDAVTIIGGGDTALAVEKYSFAKKFTHISTGGGASLEFIEGKKLPAIAALEENYVVFSRVI